MPSATSSMVAISVLSCGVPGGAGADTTDVVDQSGIVGDLRHRRPADDAAEHDVGGAELSQDEVVPLELARDRRRGGGEAASRALGEGGDTLIFRQLAGVIVPGDHQR